MQRQTLVLLAGGILALCAGAILVPQILEDDEPAPMRWSEHDELEVSVDPDLATGATAATDAIERSAVEMPAGTQEADEARVAAILRGRVVDRFQRPVAAAKVWLDFGRGPGRGGAAARQRRVPDPVLTDAEGRFAFQGQTFRTLQVSLQVLHTSYAPGVFDKFLGEIGNEVELGDLVLVRGGELIGRVTDLDGNGIPGAALRLQPENANRMRQLRDRDELLADFSTDANGWFRRANLAPGDWTVTATAKRHTEGRSPVFAAEDEQTVELEDIRLGPGYEITGWVRDVQGAPIAKAEVRLRTTGADRTTRGPMPGREHRATTDAQGRFFVEHLPAAPMVLDAEADGYLRSRIEGIDPTSVPPLQVTLPDGLRLTGVVQDEDGSPVEMFAMRAIRVRGLPVQGQPPEAADPAARLREGLLDDGFRDQIRAQFEDRRGGRDAGGPGVAGGQRPGQAGRDLGRAERHARGEFVATGLQEGVYEVHVQSPDHARFRSREVELRAGALPQHVIATLDRGVYVAGVVTKPDGAPVGGARVTLRPVVQEAAASDEAGRRRGRGPAADLLRQLAAGGSTLEATTDRDGEFVVKHAPRGTYRVQANARGFAEGSTDPFDLRADRSDIRLQLGPLGSIQGHVRGIAATDATEARVAAVPLPNRDGSGRGGMFGRGGQGGNPFQSVRVAADGSYRIDDLEPGDYIVRSWLGSPQELMRELAPKFFDGSLVADATVRGGDVATLDLVLTRPATGSVAGSALHNGLPATGFQVELVRRSDDAASPSPGPERGGRGGRGGPFGNLGRNFQTSVPASGRFQITDVPIGSYRLRVSASRRGGVLHEEPVEVTLGATTECSIVVTTQSLHGTVTCQDGTDPRDCNGRVSLLAGITTLPDNLAAWQRENPPLDARLQNGSFRFDAVKPGSYLLVATVRGRERTTQPVVVGAGGTTTIAIPAGKVTQTQNGARPTAAPGGATPARGG